MDLGLNPYEHFHPGLSVDCVIFGFHDDSLRVLLLKVKNQDLFALPGGFVKKAENLDDAAQRVLQERTGLDEIFLHQYGAFGKVNRVPGKHQKKLAEEVGFNETWMNWINTRFVTIGYYALVEYRLVQAPTPDFTSEACQWHTIEELPELMIDHRDIIISAYRELKNNLNNQPIGLNLLAEKFTMPELQSLYETILGKKLDRRNFQRKMLNNDFLVKTRETRKGGSHKAPILYRFDEIKYNEAVNNGLKSIW
jgi:8-oxo-dGTP diphosphatase